MRSSTRPGTLIAIVAAAVVVSTAAHLIMTPVVERSWRAHLAAAYGESFVRIGEPVSVSEPLIRECRRVLDGSGTVIGVVTLARVPGYRAPIEVVVAVDADGRVRSVTRQSGLDRPSVDGIAGSTTSDAALRTAVRAATGVTAAIVSGAGQ